jgi:hypothetical protein
VAKLIDIAFDAVQQFPLSFALLLVGCMLFNDGFVTCLAVFANVDNFGISGLQLYFLYGFPLLAALLAVAVIFFLEFRRMLILLDFAFVSLKLEIF